MWEDAKHSEARKKIGVYQSMKGQITLKYFVFREMWKIPCVVQIFPVLSLNSLCFPCLEKMLTKFPVFPVPWPPCITFATFESLDCNCTYFVTSQQGLYFLVIWILNPLFELKIKTMLILTICFSKYCVHLLQC